MSCEEVPHGLDLSKCNPLESSTTKSYIPSITGNHVTFQVENSYQRDENLEAQVLACRCLANLMEAMPGVAHTVVYHGAIPVLCSKLIEI